MASYKITYFNMTGRAEIPRLILVKNGVKFEDIRIEEADWPAFKEKATHMPFGQAPILETDGKVMFQSSCISRLLGKRFGMYGSNEFEECKIGAIHLTMEDICRMPFDVAFDVESEEEKAKLRTKFREKLPQSLRYLENMVEGNGCFVGNSMTVADLAFFVYIDFVHLIDDVVINWSDYPKLKAVTDNVKNDSKIAQWLKTRPQTYV